VDRADPILISRGTFVADAFVGRGPPAICINLLRNASNPVRYSYLTWQFGYKIVDVNEHPLLLPQPRAFVEIHGIVCGMLMQSLIYTLFQVPKH
jgi:hypothetical protein